MPFVHKIKFFLPNSPLPRLFPNPAQWNVCIFPSFPVFITVPPIPLDPGELLKYLPPEL